MWKRGRWREREPSDPVRAMVQEQMTLMTIMLMMLMLRDVW